MDPGDTTLARSGVEDHIDGRLGATSPRPGAREAMSKLQCINGGWVYGTWVPVPKEAWVHFNVRKAMVACSQLFCSGCNVAVKHRDGMKNLRRWPKTSLSILYNSNDPALWNDEVELEPSHRLYHCQCCWYSTPGATPVGHLDTKDIDTWCCAGHPPR